MVLDISRLKGLDTRAIAVPEGILKAGVYDLLEVYSGKKPGVIVDYRKSRELPDGLIPPGVVFIDEDSGEVTGGREDGEFINPFDSGEFFSAVGAKPGDLVILYCRTRVRSGFLAEDLTMQGAENLKVYLPGTLGLGVLLPNEVPVYGVIPGDIHGLLLENGPGWSDLPRIHANYGNALEQRYGIALEPVEKLREGYLALMGRYFEAIGANPALFGGYARSLKSNPSEVEATMRYHAKRGTLDDFVRSLKSV